MQRTAGCSFAKHAGGRTHAASCRDEADDLENLACEWRGDARTMRGISVLNFARRSWQRVTRPRPLLDVVPRVAMTFGFDFEWSLEWSVSLSSTYLPIRDWDLIYVALGAIAEILRCPVIAECRPGFVAGGEYPVMLWVSCLFGPAMPCIHMCALFLTLLIYWLDHSCPVSIFLFFENLGVYQIIV